MHCPFMLLLCYPVEDTSLQAGNNTLDQRVLQPAANAHLVLLDPPTSDDYGAAGRPAVH